MVILRSTTHADNSCLKLYGYFMNCKEYAKVYAYTYIEFSSNLIILKEWITAGMKYHVL